MIKLLIVVLLVQSAFAVFHVPLLPVLPCNNKAAIAFRALDLVFNQKNESGFSLFNVNYVQHNPSIPSTLAGFMNYVKSIPPMSIFLVRSAEEINGSFTVLHNRVVRNNQSFISANIFRFDDNCLIAEHWDVIQLEVPASKTVSGNDMYSCITCADPTFGSCPSDSLMKATAFTLMSSGFNGFDVSGIQRLFLPQFYQHNPGAPNGLAGVTQLFQYSQKNFIATKATHQLVSPVRAIASNNYLFLHSHFNVDAQFNPDPTGPGLAIVDIWRFDQQCRMIEHWDVIQPVTLPINTVSGYDMFSCVSC